MNFEKTGPATLTEQVNLYNDGSTADWAKPEMLLNIINFFTPPTGIPSQKFDGLQITREIEALVLGGVRLEDHPVFQACNILAHISGKREEAEKDRVNHTKHFLELASQVDSTAAHYLRHRFY